MGGAVGAWDCVMVSALWVDVPPSRQVGAKPGGASGASGSSKSPDGLCVAADSDFVAGVLMEKRSKPRFGPASSVGWSVPSPDVEESPPASKLRTSTVDDSNL